MRILGFTRKDWMNYLTDQPKLEEEEFTTFRFRRRDRDWEVAEVAQVVYKPRRKGGGEYMGIAQIVRKDTRWVLANTDDEVKHYAGYFAYKVVTEAEAQMDGFESRIEMIGWVGGTHHLRNLLEPMNKLTLRWVKEER